MAVRHESEPWILLNASPDLHRQLAELPSQAGDEVRRTPVAGIVLTDGEVDHTAGLLLLRESHVRLRIYSTAAVRAALSGDYPVLSMLEHYCGVDWRELRDGEATALADSSLQVEPFATGGDAPLYMGDAEGPGSIGLIVRDTIEQRSLCYLPALEALEGEVLERMQASDCVLVDGTFWRSDDLVALGMGERDSWAMGHAPLSGEGGTLTALSTLQARTILVHINNTNPILLEDSSERAAVERAGVTIAHDGLEFDL